MELIKKITPKINDEIKVNRLRKVIVILLAYNQYLLRYE